MSGIIRKIDSLGRIVIPKEIRKQLHIKDNESIEICPTDNYIMLKKHSDIINYNELVEKYINVLSRYIAYDILITDRDKYIGGIGKLKNDYINKDLNDEFENILNTITSYQIIDFSETFSTNIMVMPINNNGVIIGLIIIILNNKDISKEDITMIKLTTDLLIKNIED